MEAEVEVVKEKSSLALSKEPPIILKTSFQRCPVCLIGTMVNTQEKGTLLIFLHNSNTINLPGGESILSFSSKFRYILPTWDHLNPQPFVIHFRYSTALKLVIGSCTFCSHRCCPTSHLAIIPKGAVAYSLYKGWHDKDHRHH